MYEKKLIVKYLLQHVHTNTNDMYEIITKYRQTRGVYIHKSMKNHTYRRLTRGVHKRVNAVLQESTSSLVGVCKEYKRRNSR